MTTQSKAPVKPTEVLMSDRDTAIFVQETMETSAKIQ
jgi:hypothetical protein